MMTRFSCAARIWHAWHAVGIRLNRVRAPLLLLRILRPPHAKAVPSLKHSDLAYIPVLIKPAFKVTE